MFDNNTDISSALPLLGPHAYHPDAPATGVAMAYALSQSYLYCRTHSRPIGYQTYRQTHLTNLRDTRSIVQTSLTGIAQFRAQLPEHATHIVCTAFFGIVGEHNNFEVYHRADISDGTDSDIGSVVMVEGQAGPSALINADGFTVYDYAGSHSVEFYVERQDTLGTATSTVSTIVASAYALEAGTANALPYHPYLILARWESL